jgi:hypothetical protein
MKQGRELFFLSADGVLMWVEIRVEWEAPRAGMPPWSKNPIHAKSNDDGGKGPSCDAVPPVTLA